MTFNSSFNATAPIINAVFQAASEEAAKPCDGSSFCSVRNVLIGTAVVGVIVLGTTAYVCRDRIVRAVKDIWANFKHFFSATKVPLDESLALAATGVGVTLIFSGNPYIGVPLAAAGGGYAFYRKDEIEWASLLSAMPASLDIDSECELIPTEELLAGRGSQKFKFHSVGAALEGTKINLLLCPVNLTTMTPGEIRAYIALNDGGAAPHGPQCLKAVFQGPDTGLKALSLKQNLEGYLASKYGLSNTTGSFVSLAKVTGEHMKARKDLLSTGTSIIVHRDLPGLPGVVIAEILTRIRAALPAAAIAAQVR